MADSIVYAYDNADNRTSVNSTTATITFTYDPVDRPKSKVEIIAGQTYSLSFRYDGNDNLRYITYPNSRQVEYRYNANNQVDTVPGYINNSITYTWQVNLRFLLHERRENDYGYNARFVNETIKAGSDLDLRYRFDSRGNTSQ